MALGETFSQGSGPHSWLMMYLPNLGSSEVQMELQNIDKSISEKPHWNYQQ